MSDIIYPTLDFFLYDLRNALADSSDELEQKRDIFNKKLPEDIHATLFQKDTYFEDEFVNLIGNNGGYKGFERLSESYLFKGYYYPVRLNDMYGLLLDCSIEDKKETQPAQCFKFLKAEIERRLNGQPATIGQTWMISGWLPQSEAKPPEDIAKACYQALIPDSKWEQDFQGKGQLLEATIFELSRYRIVMPETAVSPTTIQNVQDNQHVIIILYPDEATFNNSALFYQHWLRLFSYRHKILWAYGQTRLLKRTIKNLSTTLEEDRQAISRNQTNYQEEKLQKILIRVQASIKNYTIDLYQLEFQGSSIEINLSNYDKRLETIKERLETVEKKAESDLKLFDKFPQSVKDKYLLQITKDSENLKRILKFQEDTINAVRSRVEVEKAERDRHFQDIITVLGVGWSVASFVPSLDKLSDNPKDPVKQFLTQSPLPPTWVKPAIPVVYKVSIAFVAALLTLLVIRLWPGLASLIRKKK